MLGYGLFTPAVLPPRAIIAHRWGDRQESWLKLRSRRYQTQLGPLLTALGVQR